MMSTSCSATTMTSSSMGLTDWVPIALPSFMCTPVLAFHSMLLFACQSSDGGTIMMLAPAVIRSGWAGPLSARKMPSNAYPVFFMSHLYISGSCHIDLGRLLLFWSIPGFSVLVLVFLVLERYARWLVLLRPVEHLVVVAFFCYWDGSVLSFVLSSSHTL